MDEDLENVVVRIPRSAGVISDPSSILPFVKRLMLEEDETHLTELGSTEVAKRSVALAYQVSPWSRAVLFCRVLYLSYH